MWIIPFSHKKVEKTLKCNASCGFALEQDISKNIHLFVDITQIDYLFLKLKCDSLKYLYYSTVVLGIQSSYNMYVCSEKNYFKPHKKSYQLSKSCKY